MNQEELFFENETRKHQQEVSKLLMLVAQELLDRAISHDESKLKDPEREIFVKVTPRLKELTYGSDEYKAQLEEMGSALEHHYKANSHHPEYHAKFEDMTLIDIIELVCDWLAATRRHADGSIIKSIEYNEKRFGINPQLSNIFRRTVHFLNWQIVEKTK